MQKAVDKRTAKLSNILSASNSAIGGKGGGSAGTLSGLPAAIAGIPQAIGETVVWQEPVITPGAEDLRVAAAQGTGFSAVTVKGDGELTGENIRRGVDIFGVVGTREIGLQIPEEYAALFLEAKNLCLASYEDFMENEWVHTFVAESDTYITIGFAAESGIAVSSYDAGTTEYSSEGWVGCLYGKDGGEMTAQDYRQESSQGGNFGKNLRYSSCYIMCGDVCLFPTGAAAYPAVTAIDYGNWDSGSFTETLESGEVLSYSVDFDSEGRPIGISGANGSGTSISWEASE